MSINKPTTYISIISSLACRKRVNEHESNYNLLLEYKEQEGITIEQINGTRHMRIAADGFSDIVSFSTFVVEFNRALRSESDWYSVANFFSTTHMVGDKIDGKYYIDVFTGPLAPKPDNNTRFSTEELENFWVKEVERIALYAFREIYN